MYKKVVRRVPAAPHPHPTPAVQAPVPPVQAVLEKPKETPKTKVDRPAFVPKLVPKPVDEPVAKKSPKKSAKKAPVASKEKAVKKSPAKKPKWSEDMTQKELYKIAKGLGLSVLSRDPKAWIVKRLKDIEK
jgi:hypothetical protein